MTVGLWRDEKHVYYTNYPGEEPLVFDVSITGAIKAVDKSDVLVNWAKGYTAEVAIRNLPMLSTMIAQGGEAATVEYLKGLAETKKTRAGDRGTRVHVIADAISRGIAYDVLDLDLPYVDAFRRYYEERTPVCLSSEYLVCSPTHGYAGTGDRVDKIWCPVHARIDRWRLDIKTMEINEKGYPKGPYKETALQLAAAEYADFCGRPGDPRKYLVPKADHNGVLALHSDGTYAVRPYDVTPDTFEAFLASLRLWQWLTGPAKSVIGQPLTRKEEAA